VGGRHPPTAVGTDEDLEAAVHGQAAPVAVIAAQDLRLLVVLLGTNRSGDERAAAVCSDDHVGLLGDGLAALGVAADTGDAPFLDDDVLDGETLADLRACLGRAVDEQLVEHGASRTVRDRGVGCPRASGDRERAEVERVRVDRRTTGCREPLEQSPLAKRRHSGRVDDVGRHRVARERRPVDDEHVVPLAREKHRGGRPGAARSDHDCVVLVLGHGALLVSWGHHSMACRVRLRAPR